MKIMSSMSLEGMTELFQGEGLSIENDDKLSSSSEDQFPCVVCNATFVTRMSLIRHMILHEDDTENDDGNYTKPSEDEQDVTVSQSQTHIPEQNLLENYLKTKYNKPSSSSSFNGSSTNTNGHNNNNVSVNGKRKRPVPNLKPLPSLIEMKTQVQTQQQQQKNFQCQLCGVFFWKKEDLSRHVTRTHTSLKFQCPYCQRNISRRDHLKRHIKNVHPEMCNNRTVGPFLNQGAGRPPKQSRETVEENPTKKQKLSNSTTSINVNNEIPAELLQNLGMDINQINQLNLINESKIEMDSSDLDVNGDNADDMLDDAQFSLDTDDFNPNVEDGLFTDEANTEFLGNDDDIDDDNMLAMKTEDVDSYAIEEDYVGDLGILSEDNNNIYEEDNNNDGNGILEEEQEEELNLKQEVVNGSAERKFKCQMCDASFMNKINMQRHMSTHSVSRAHKCSVCGKGFLRKEHLTKHLSSVHSGLKYRCQFCRKDISRKDHLLRHIRNCHPQEFAACDMIDAEPQISQVPAVTLHGSSRDIRVAALSCDMCSEIFTHIDELMEHQSDAHSDIRKFKCEQCPKSFKRKEHLVKHLSTHAASATKSYSCSECNKVFTSMESAQAHLRQAHGKKNYNANQGNNNNNKNNVKVKNNTSSSSSFPCNLCDNSFQQRAHLFQHLKAYHGVSNPERRFTEPSFNAATNISITPPLPPPQSRPIKIPQRQIVQQPINKKQQPIKQQQFPSFHQQQGSLLVSKSMGKPQIRSLLGSMHASMNNKQDEGSLGSLMGLINKGQLSLSKIEQN